MLNEILERSGTKLATVAEKMLQSNEPQVWAEYAETLRAIVGGDKTKATAERAVKLADRLRLSAEMMALHLGALQYADVSRLEAAEAALRAKVAECSTKIHEVRTEIWKAVNHASEQIDGLYGEMYQAEGKAGSLSAEISRRQCTPSCFPELFPNAPRVTDTSYAELIGLYDLLAAAGLGPTA